MRIEFHKGSAGLERLVACYCFVDAMAAAVEYRVPAMMANGYLLLGGGARFRFADGRCEELRDFALLGPTTAAFELEMDAGCVLAIFALLPEGWHATIGLPAEEGTDRLLPADVLWPAGVCAALHHRLLAASRPGEYARHIEAFLTARAVARARERNLRVVAIDRWLEQTEALSLDRLCARLDVGARQASRITQDVYGMGPKLLAMKYRALRSATRLAAHGPAALPRAVESYADQSHMIRDFHRFVGWTPRVFMRDRVAVASATILGRWNAGYRRRLGLWG